MKSKSRFINSVVETARRCDTAMPWTRGPARAAMIARRVQNETAEKRSA